MCRTVLTRADRADRADRAPHRGQFELVQSELDAPVDFLNEQDIIQRYYPHCCKAVQAATGATKVFAFDHNVRSRALKAKQQLIEGGNAVQARGPPTLNVLVARTSPPP